jgi:CheY-like chemotaxis protein
MVTGDPTQLEQVLLNLMNNAEQALRPCVDADHGPSAGQIAIRTRCENQEVILEVEDNGPGIPDESRAHIWDPFWTTKDEGSGTGLGLTVVHGIIADHGGTISLESAPGFGARFVVRLPAIPDARISGASRAIRPLDVLIVDPGASDLVFVERFLTSRGHAVINAANGELAVRLAGQTSFDAVVCAAGLVDHDGLSIASILRSTSGCARARFVLSSRDLPGATQPRGVTDGSALIAHPYDVEELRRLIEGD